MQFSLMNAPNTYDKFTGKIADNQTISQGTYNLENILGKDEIFTLWNKISLKHKCELWAGEYQAKLTIFHRILIWLCIYIQ